MDTSDMLWNAYQDGNLTAHEIVRALTADLVRVLGRKTIVQHAEALLRERLSLVVERMDEQVISSNDLTIELRGPSLRYSYDPKLLAALVQRLLDEANPLAAEIRACRVPQGVAGGLVVTPTKAAKGRIARAATQAATLPELPTERAERWVDQYPDVLDAPNSLREDRSA